VPPRTLALPLAALRGVSWARRIEHAWVVEMAAGERAVEQKGRVERVIASLATALGDTIGWMASNGVLFLIFLALWVIFGAAVVLSQGSLDQAWETIRGWPLIVQAVAWLLFLPVMFGLWVWETSWPLIIRLLLVLGAAGWNLLVLVPRAAASE
jgi:ABC-type amino acid transport system permease subunit